MRPQVETLVDAALLIVATCVVFVPEPRLPAIRVALYVLLFVACALFVRRMHVGGMLGLSPREIFHSPRRPRVSLLSLAATVMAVVAIMVDSLR